MNVNLSEQRAGCTAEKTPSRYRGSSDADAFVLAMIFDTILFLNNILLPC